MTVPLSSWWWWSMLACRPSACSVGPCACINLHLVHLPQSDSGAMRLLVASRSWAWCFIHFVLAPSVLIPPLGWLVLSPDHAHPELSQPLVVLGVTVMDPIQSSHYPDRPIPSHRPLPLGGRGGLLPSSLCRLVPSSWSPSPSPSISLPPLARPSEQLGVPIPTLTLPFLFSDPPTPHPHGVLGLTPPSLPSSCPSHLFSSPSSLVCPGGLGLLWSGPVRSGFALPILPCRALALPWLGLPWACPALLWCGLALTRV